MQKFAVKMENLNMDKIKRNMELMKKFEIMINTANEKLALELISNNAIFYTPISTQPLYGPKGYLSIVYFMRKGFQDIKWKLEEIITSNDKAAVYWTLTGTHNGEFMNILATGKKIKTNVMNFYYFDEKGKIIKDIAAEGIIGILKPLGLIKI